LLPGSLDLIFIAQKHAGEQSREEVTADFMAVLGKLVS